MKFVIEVYDYDPAEGICTEWDDNHVLKAESKDYFVIKANAGALQELAVHLLTLAQEKVPPGSHLHYDALNHMTEAGSMPFVIEKI